MKKALLIIAAVALALIIALQVLVEQSQPTSTEILETRVATLPDLRLLGINGTPINMRTGKPIILIYFNTDCDHCQREVAQLRERSELFAKVSLVFMSAQPLEEIEEFASSNDFGTIDARFVQVTPDQVATVFGTLGLPHIFIFSKEGRLLDIFAGETAPEVIASVLSKTL